MDGWMNGWMDDGEGLLNCGLVDYYCFFILNELFWSCAMKSCL